MNWFLLLDSGKTFTLLFFYVETAETELYGFEAKFQFEFWLYRSVLCTLSKLLNFSGAQCFHW